VGCPPQDRSRRTYATGSIERDWAGRDPDQSAGDRAALVEARDRAATKREAVGEQRAQAAVDRFHSEADRTHAAKGREHAAHDRHAADDHDNG